jgi:hypothetical protein
MTGTAKQILIALGLSLVFAASWRYLGLSLTALFVVGYFAGDFWQLRRGKMGA